MGLCDVVGVLNVDYEEKLMVRIDNFSSPSFLFTNLIFLNSRVSKNVMELCGVVSVLNVVTRLRLTWCGHINRRKNSV